MIGKEITKHLSTEVDIMSEKMCEEIKHCYIAALRVNAMAMKGKYEIIR